MTRIYAIYSMIVLAGFLGSSYAGYAFDSLFTAAKHVSKTDSHYHK